MRVGLLIALPCLLAGIAWAADPPASADPLRRGLPATPAAPATQPADPFRRPATPAPAPGATAPADPFRAPGSSAPADPFRTPAASGPANTGAPAAATEWRLPTPLARAVGAVARWQRDFNLKLTRSIRAVREEGAWAPVFAIIALAFGYGVFHAAGPGHGKVVTGAYFLTQRARLVHGVIAGALIATVQAASAIVIVGVLGLLLDIGGTRIISHTLYLELASYALIGLIGLGMLYKALRYGGHTHGHGKHGHGGHGEHTHDHGEGAVLEALAKGQGRWPHRDLVTASVAAGVRPCTGAILVLLFALANGILLVGIVATLAMALGVALTVSAINVGSILLNRGLAAALGARAAWAAFAHRALGLVGAGLILALGTVLFLGTLQRLGAPL